MYYLHVSSYLKKDHKTTFCKLVSWQVEQSNLPLQAFLVNDTCKAVFCLLQRLDKSSGARLCLLKLLEQRKNNTSVQ